MAQGLRDVAGLPDPVGEVVRGGTLANGLELRQVRVPVRRGRDDLRGPPQRHRRRRRHLPEVRQRGAAARQLQRPLQQRRDRRPSCAARRGGAGLRADVVQLVPGDSHESVKVLMRARGLVDVLIPRGGAGLIRSVVEESTVPVIETGVGNCHVYVDAAADLDKALAIVVNAKTQRTSVCNAAESLLVHAGRRRRRSCPGWWPRCRTPGVTIHGDDAFAAYDGVVPATDEDCAQEYLSLDIAAARRRRPRRGDRPHPRASPASHTDAIVTEDQAAARRFVAEVDSAAVLVNASTRFTDGGEFGFGAEIGITTQKLHARGPMGLPEMTSTKYVVTGDGHVR